MGMGAGGRRWEALGEALGLFAFVMLYAWWLRSVWPWLALLAPAFTVTTHAARGESARELGFGGKDFRAAFPVLLPWAAAVAGVLLAAGAAAGTVRPIPAGQALLGLSAYVVWGTIQQYFLNGFLANRLAECAGDRGRLVPLAAAGLFSLAHLPNWFLMAVALVGGYVSVLVYRRFPSLYVLGIAHAAIAFVLYVVTPDSISGHFLIGPRYLMDRAVTRPEWLP